jgi:sulfite exporter TauE/SafE
MNQILLAFVTGLTTGGLSCFAVQGGLLAGILAEQKKEETKKSLFLFLTSKFISHLLLGGLLGLLGSALVITSNIQGLMQIISGLFILLMALKIADLHPIFRNFSITPPKFILRYIRNESRSQSFFAPILVGFLTVLIPCGTTQAMILLSVASGSIWYGSMILGAFVLGTTPIFFILGVASEKILSFKPLRIFAVLTMFYLALTAINSGQILRNSKHTYQNYKAVLFSGTIKNDNQADQVNGKQLVTINVNNSGYTTDTKTLKIGVPVKLTVVSKNVQSCARSFVIPSLNISKLLPSTGTEIIEFTPTELGILTFSCSMGMYTGSFNIVE